MGDTKMTKEKWVSLFEASGIDAAARDRWHHAFEAREPDGHQAFLEWLGLPPPEVARIRTASRG
jgi:hypothetical protein